MQRVTEHAYDALGGIGRLRRIWPWLGESRIPGRPGASALVERRMSEQAALIEDEQVRRDRRAKFLALRDGKTPAGPGHTPLRLGAVRARSSIAGQIRVVGISVRATLPRALTDPTLHRRAHDCPWCDGTGLAQIPPGWIPWAWPDPAPSCSLCGGHAKLCAVCAALGPCACDLADVVVDACLDAIAAALPHLRDPVLAERAAGGLNAAADLGCATLGLREVDLRVIKAECPACGRRDLWADVASPKHTEWSVTCRSKLCRCAGAGCGCGRPVRWPGRAHRWPADEFGDLAHRLGVTERDLVRG